MRLIAYIEDYGDYEFNIEAGGVYKDTITETLDSFSCNLPNCPINLSLRPYQFVRIKDKDNAFNKVFLIDNFTTEQLYFYEEDYDIRYNYQLNLVSPTKMLETIICPNRAILHSKLETQKSVGTIIYEMCNLYMPRVKIANGSTWEYRPIINFLDIVSYSIFNVNCPDLQWNNPSLRDIITTLMQYCGCIPSIREDSGLLYLSYINLRKDTIPFVIPQNKQLFVKKSNSTDSYVNTLYSPLKNVLDNNNKVVNETIGFRDKENVFLKQAENYALETSFGIERINSLYMLIPCALMITFTLKPNGYVSILYDAYDGCNITNNTNETITLNRFEFYEPNYNSNPGQTLTYLMGGVKASHIHTFPTNTTIAPNSTYHFSTVDISADVNIDNCVQKLVYNGTSTKFNNMTDVGIVDYAYEKVDITSLIHETQERNNLDTDYTQVEKSNELLFKQIPLSVIANNYYTTLNYTYGDNKIKGFSNSFEMFHWIGSLQQTFMEALDTYFFKSTTPSGTQVQNAMQEYGIDISDLYSDYSAEYAKQFINLKTPTELVGYDIVEYGLYLFDIEYVPFNNFTSKHYKEQDIPLQFNKADTQESSIITFDEFSKREQQKINRLGNDVLQIRQPQALPSEVNAIGFNLNEYFCKFDDSVIFQREIQFYDTNYEVNYVASKDYILRDYFTALQNKYRAYEYVDINESIERKEINDVFVRIGYDYISNACQKLYSPNFSFIASQFLNLNCQLTYAIQSSDYYYNRDNNGNPIMQTDGYFKTDVSILTNQSAIFVSYNNLDNQSFGNFLRQNTDNNREISSLGGLIQGAYIWQNYDTSHKTIFTDLSLRINDKILTYEDYATFVSNHTRLPLLTMFNESTDILFALRDFTLAPTNAIESGNTLKKPYYKALNEKINETIEFTYYSVSNGIRFNEMFVELNKLKDTSNYGLIFEPSNSGILRDGWHNESTSISVNVSINNPYTEFKFSGVGINFSFNPAQVGKFLIVKVYDINIGKYHDLFSFDTRLGTTIYFSMNDTKTDKVYVMNTTSKLLECNKKVKTNESTRLVVDIV